MATPQQRLSQELVDSAQAESGISKRSIPRQIEYWAELGRTVEKMIDYQDVVRVMQGLAHLNVETVNTEAVSSAKVFQKIEQYREGGVLQNLVTENQAVYEVSQSTPGLLDRILPDGTRQTGRFVNGEFDINKDN